MEMGHAVALNELFVDRPGTAPESAGGPGLAAWQDEDGPSFEDVLDIVNPLQHLPVISSIYRYVSGDTIGAVPRLLGGALFGGPAGVLASFVNVAIDGATGNDLGGHVMEAVLGPQQREPAVDAATLAALQPAAGDTGPAPGASPGSSTPPPVEPAAARPSANAASPPPPAPPPLPSATRDVSAASSPAAPGRPAIKIGGSGTSGSAAIGGAPGRQPAQHPVPLQPPPAALSQRMSDALDKYVALQRDRRPAATIDVAP